MLSFDPIKTITALDGGAIIVNTLDELNKLKSMRQLGFNSTKCSIRKQKKVNQ